VLPLHKHIYKFLGVVDVSSVLRTTIKRFLSKAMLYVIIMQGGQGQGPGGQGGGQQQQMLQMFQQKIGNLELTVNALISALDEQDVVSEEEINEKAQELVQEIQEQQQAAQDGQGENPMG
jgi:hypothetical protein